MFLKTFVFVAALSQVCQTDGARILSLIPFPGKSHYINIQPLLQRLAERGHELTVITTHYEENPLPNYKQIILDKSTFWDYLGKTGMDKFSMANMNFADEMRLMWDGIYYTTEVAFNSSSLQKFIREDKSRYDLVFIELFYQESFYMLAHKYRAPIVAINTMGYSQYLGNFMGNPQHLSYMPHEFFSVKGRMGVWTRVKNIYYTAVDALGRNFYVIPRHEKLIERHFKDEPKPRPTIQEIERNISLVFVNTHFSIDVVRPYIPGIVEIGGVHIKPVKKIPEKIQKFIDGAEHGVIFFSLGSNLKSADMPRDKIDMLLRVFSKLKQRVLWKWEDENLPGKTDNIMTGPWLPQTDILAHPKVRLFITHGGLLSTLEAIHFGIPIIGIPVFADQHLNVAKSENLGFGIKIAFQDLKEDTMTQAIDRIIYDPKYYNTAKDISEIFRDRPLSPMDNAIYWIEYVIKHKGASFMKSPVLELFWFEYKMIDAFFILCAGFVVGCLLILYFTKKTLCFFTFALFGASNNKNQKLKTK